MKTKCLLILAMLAAIGASAQTTAFTYQGQINDNGGPASGSYDFQFSLLDAGTNGNVLGEATNGTVTVKNGLFNATVDFGSAVFSGAPRWLLVGVRTNGSLGPYTNLPPPTLITPTPYAITAINASNLLGPLSVTNLTGNLSAGQLPAGVVINGQIGLILSGSFNGSFTGDGSGLANLNAGSLSGSIPAGALTSVPAASLTGSIPLAQLPGVILTNTATNVTLAGSFSGDGSGLTNLASANLTGTIPSALITSVAASNVTGVFAPGQLPALFITNGQINVTMAGAFSGDGSGLTNLTSSNLTGVIPSALITSVAASNVTGILAPEQLPPSVLTNEETGVTLNGAFSGAFTGNGAGLTGFSASQLGGTLSLSQLPPSVVINNENPVILGGTFSGTFSGNGGGLNSLNAGTLVGTLPNGALSGEYDSAVSLLNPNNVIAGTILNSTASSLSDVVGSLTVTNSALFTNTVLIITNSSGQGIVESPGGVTNSGNLRVGGWLVGPTTNAGGFWVTNGALFVTNTTLSAGVILGGNSGNIFFSGTITGNGSGLTEGGGSPIGTSSSNLTLTASNTVEAALLSAGAAITNLAFVTGITGTNFILATSNSLETALLSSGTTLSNYAQSGNVILSNIVSAGGTLPIGATLSNAVLAGPTTNFANLLVTNGTLAVSNSSGSVTISSGNIAFSGLLTGNGSALTGVTAEAPTSGNFNFGYDTTSQAVGIANTYQNVTFNNPQSLNAGWTYAGGRFTAATPGLYYVSYTAEAETGNGSIIIFQALKNGSPIAGAGLTTIFADLGPISASQSFMVSVAAGDVLAFQFQGDATDVKLAAVNGAPSFTANIFRLQ